MEYVWGVVIAGIVLIIIILIVLLSKISRTQDSIKSSVSQSVVDNMDKLISSLGNLKEEYGQISAKLLTLNEINNNTKTLKSYLTNPKVRGRWEEKRCTLSFLQKIQTN